MTAPNDVPAPFEVGGPGAVAPPTFDEGFRPKVPTGIAAVAPFGRNSRACARRTGPFFCARNVISSHCRCRVTAHNSCKPHPPGYTSGHAENACAF